MKAKLHTLIFGLDIEDYHRGTVGFSSSQFKDLLDDDEDTFIAKYIEKRIEREDSQAFDVGTYFHTGTLEPHKLKDDCVVFPGKIRRGAKWDSFKKKHSKKAIVTQAQKDMAVGLIKTVKESKMAQKYLIGKPEVSLFIEIAVFEEKIYAVYFGNRLTRNGWVKDVQGAFNAKRSGYKFVVKVRADMLGRLYISDLKSTRGNARSMVDMKKTVSNYHYDLSASLYLDMFSLMRPEIVEFVWIFASKSILHSKTWRASPDNILVGRAKYMRAMIALAKCAGNGWKVRDTIGVLEPAHWEREWLREKEDEENDLDLL